MLRQLVLLTFLALWVSFVITEAHVAIKPVKESSDDLKADASAWGGQEGWGGDNGGYGGGYGGHGNYDRDWGGGYQGGSWSGSSGYGQNGYGRIQWG